MNLPELLKTVPKIPLTVQTVIQFSGFLQANLRKIEFHQLNDWNGDTYVILKWAHKVPELRILP